MNRNLFLSILAMDSYNRGYGKGIKDLSDLGLIGNATIIDVPLPSDSVAAGFYATAYIWNSETIISYRGTDFDRGQQMVNDIFNGWSSFTGIGTNSQFALAKDFFTAVTGAGFLVGPGFGPANTTLTGHSLGGALAGYVGARGLPAETVVFDPIPYGKLTWQFVVQDAFNATEFR